MTPESALTYRPFALGQKRHKLLVILEFFKTTVTVQGSTWQRGVLTLQGQQNVSVLQGHIRHQSVTSSWERCEGHSMQHCELEASEYSSKMLW